MKSARSCLSSLIPDLEGMAGDLWIRDECVSNTAYFVVRMIREDVSQEHSKLNAICENGGLANEIESYDGNNLWTLAFGVRDACGERSMPEIVRGALMNVYGRLECASQLVKNARIAVRS